MCMKENDEHSLLILGQNGLKSKSCELKVVSSEQVGKNEFLWATVRNNCDVEIARNNRLLKTTDVIFMIVT